MFKEIATTRLKELEEELLQLQEERTKNEVEERIKQARMEFTLETINVQRGLLGMKLIPTKKNMPFTDPNED